MQNSFALLDDSASTAQEPRSRLYTGFVRELSCVGGAGLPDLLAEMEQALQQGMYAVAQWDYECGHALHGMAPDAGRARILLFAQCESLSRDQVNAWLAPQAGIAGIAGIEANVDEDEFTRALDAIHRYIEAGDTYQVNYTYRLRFDAYGTPAALFARLRARQSVPYGALIALPDGGAVCSLSPELFVRHTRGALTARPMKGTAPAETEGAGQEAENARRAAALAADTKNRAENLMIVDLLRNDLGRVAESGSVRVPQLFDVRRYGRVLQMTSTVEARVRADASLADIVRALYPCGSITGAPKRRTMEIIAELESAPRGLYTGAIGWFDQPRDGERTGDFCLSVPIRTLVLQPEVDGVRRGEMGVGAGIVYDSDPSEEYAECKLKARFLTSLEPQFELFETMYWDGAVRHFERHLQRLQTSARYFGIACEGIEQAVAEACAILQGPHRVRLALRPDGGTDVVAAPLVPLNGPVNVLLAPDSTQSDSVYLRHKSSHRERYDAAWRAAEQQGAFDMLFFNERGELTEGGRSNVFVKLGGRWFTPPLASGVLPGVMRAVLLEDAALAATERVITRSQVLAADDIMLCNALRGTLPAALVP
ncbi:MAG TPA: chorismate-binding protein [Burkholderiaceae bacterium]